MQKMIDLRSDTVTTPTSEMRLAMAEAEVGDDVYREDPTVIRLEKLAAEILGKEAAIFVPSGTMGNQIAVKLHTQPGQEVICEERGHIFNYEMAATAAISGCLVRPVPSRRGFPSWEQIEAHLSPPFYYRAQTGLVTLENTHNFAGGTVLGPEETSVLAEKCHQRGLPLHLDGARIFNAAVRIGCPVSELVRHCDSVMITLSKGLCAPVGSMLAGTTEFIERAWRVRKMLGGGMRQVGVLAAAGLIALEKMTLRLAEDHVNARRLAESLNELNGFEVDLEAVQTNIVIVQLRGADANEIMQTLRGRSVLAGYAGPRLLRLVTHKDVSALDIENVISVFADLAAA